MPTALTIAGAALELVGLALVFAELAVIRSREFGVPIPWAWVIARARRRCDVRSSSISAPPCP